MENPSQEMTAESAVNRCTGIRAGQQPGSNPGCYPAGHGACAHWYRHLFPTGCTRSGDCQRPPGAGADHLAVGYSSRAAAGLAILAALRDAKVELVVLAGYKPILDSCVVNAYPMRIINIHPSLLPAFAGGMAPRPQADALAAGVKISGCTAHFVTEAVDEGPIIAQASVPVYDDDTVEQLSARILEMEHQVLPRVIEDVLYGTVRVEGRRVLRQPDKLKSR